MNPDYEDAQALLQNLLTGMRTDTKLNKLNQHNRKHNDISQYCETVLCPPAPYLSEFSKMLHHAHDKAPPYPANPTTQISLQISLGAQDIHWQDNGAWTGKISAAILASMGIHWVILGHSELRTHFGEKNAHIRKKIEKAHAHNIKTIVCIGETLEERNQGQYKQVIEKQLQECVFDLEPTQMLKVVIAYEPVWAIGTGQSAATEDVADMHNHIRGILEKKFPHLSHPDLSQSNLSHPIRILYGGSMKSDNAAGLLSQANVDGGLIGGASLRADEFLQILKISGQVPISQT